MLVSSCGGRTDGCLSGIAGCILFYIYICIYIYLRSRSPTTWTLRCSMRCVVMWTGFSTATLVQFGNIQPLVHHGYPLVSRRIHITSHTSITHTHHTQHAQHTRTHAHYTPHTIAPLPGDWADWCLGFEYELLLQLEDIYKEMELIGALESNMSGWCSWRIYIYIFTSSTAQGGGGSFKNRKPIIRRDWLLWIRDGRANPLMDRKVLEVSSLSLSFSDYLPTYQPIFYVSIYLSIDRSIYLSISLSIYLSIYLPIYLSIRLPIYLSIHPSIYLSIRLPIYLSIDLSIYRSFYLSIFLSIYLSVCLSICRAVYLWCSVIQCNVV